MKKTARVIVTTNCNRNCPGCCNSKINEIPDIVDISMLANYEEIVITGGEPMLNPDSLLKFIKALRKQNKEQKIYLYTAHLAMEEHRKILGKLDGITVTLHAEATDDDIRSLKYMSELLYVYMEDLDMRLFIDKRVYEKYDLSNIRLQAWDVVRKLEWKENCCLAENEDLLMFRLF